MERSRFSLLLLDPGEYFFEDFSVVMIDEDVTDENFDSRKQLGRIKMCSKSIVFDPKDPIKPLLKIPLKECTSISEWHRSRPKKLCRQKNVITLDTKQHVEMLEGNAIAPYKFIMKPRTFLFQLNYVEVSDCLPHFCQLHRASGLPVAEQNMMISAIVFSRQSRVPFDLMWLEDLYEQVIMEVQGSRITPLVRNPGRILLSSTCLYFQSFNNIEQYPVLKIHLRHVKRIVKRRFLLQNVGLEIYCRGRSRVEHLLLCLSCPNERDQLNDKILEQAAINLDETNQEMMTLQWQNGVISNYEYLQYLNSMADRTFNDLTQYPVFPWVLNDYSSEDLDFDDPMSYRDLSKPVGALNPLRLKRLKDRYEEMQGPKFLYGSHYSAPGFVLFYLVRKYPHYMLCLQNGRFDHPDRMFNSMADVWKNVQINMADFKELLPEFYDIEGGGDFCSNILSIDFGRRHDGSQVGDVELPCWAKDSRDFVRKMRNALESDYVSRNLHHWIDLIFGYKQRGEEAIKADNVFYYLCYEGAVDLDSITDSNQRHALEVQIMEFGQIPKQVFTLPHPCKIIHHPQCFPGHILSSKGEGDKLQSGVKEEAARVQGERICWQWQGSLEKRCNVNLQSHREEVTAVALSASHPDVNNSGHRGDGRKAAEWNVFSVGQDSLLKIHKMPSGQQVRSAALSPVALSACVPLLLTTHHQSHALLTVGGCASMPGFCVSVSYSAIYDVEYGRVVEQAKLHEDAVSCLIWVEPTGEGQEGILVSGSRDCSVCLWRLLGPLADPSTSTMHPQFLLRHPARSLVVQLEHDAHITCLDCSMVVKLLASGTGDGDLFLWCMQTFSLKHKLEGHTGPVSAMKFSPDGSRLVSCGMDSFLRVFDMKTKMQVYSKAMDEQLRCLAWDGYHLLIGGNEGSLYVWNLMQVELIQKIEAHEGAVTCLAVSSDGSIVVSGGEDRRIHVWSPVSTD